MSKPVFTTVQVAEGRAELERTIDKAVADFIAKYGLDQWQVKAQWGRVTVSTSSNGQGTECYMASVTVNI